MRGFAISVALLLAIAALTAVNSVFTLRAADGIYDAILEARGETCAAAEPKIKSCIALVEEKRKLLRISLKENDLKDVLTKLESARSHCLCGNGEEMNASLSEALRLVEEWKKGETPNLWNIL